LLARSIGNMSFRRMAGFDRDGTVHIDKQLFIATSAERLRDCWRSPEDFPRFMRNVLDVRPLGDQRWHWKVAGPAGSVVEWDTHVEEVERDRRFAWRTSGDGVVEHRGSVTIEPQNGGSRLHVSMDYTPTAGLFGHLVAKAFARDPQKQFDEDLMRLKTYLETGTPAHDAARTARTEPAPTRERMRRPLH
jgi:uncharacterized membrane protein